MVKDTKLATCRVQERTIRTRGSSKSSYTGEVAAADVGMREVDRQGRTSSDAMDGLKTGPHCCSNLHSHPSICSKPWRSWIHSTPGSNPWCPQTTLSAYEVVDKTSSSCLLGSLSRRLQIIFIITSEPKNRQAVSRAVTKCENLLAIISSLLRDEFVSFLFDGREWFNAIITCYNRIHERALSSGRSFPFINKSTTQCAFLGVRTFCSQSPGV